MTTTSDTRFETEAERNDCLGRDRFGGSEPDDSFAPEAIRKPEDRTFADFLRDHRRVFFLLLTAVAAIAFSLVVLPQIAGFGDTLHRIEQGDKSWLLIGVCLEAISIAGYVVFFRTVFSCAGVRINWSASYQITMAGLVATKLFAAAGAGGVALTAWALRAAGSAAGSWPAA